MPSSTDNRLTAALESLLFAADGALTTARLAELLDVQPEQVAAVVADLQAQIAGRGVQVVQLAGGYRMATRPEFADYVRRLREPEPERLSRAALETLTIVAYRQPITRPEIDALRGVDSSGVLANLVEKGLLQIAGRKDAPGRPLIFETTDHFLSTFGLASLDELPMLDPLRQASERQLTLPAAPSPPRQNSEDAPADEALAASGRRAVVAAEPQDSDAA
jgi:segregation and condensation protein B